MQPAAVETLVRKGRFEPPVAMAIAEAIDVTLAHAQVVTVPVLDARMAAVDAKLAELRAEMHAGFQTLEAKMDARFREQDARMDARFGEQDARMDARFGEQGAKIDARFALADARLQKFKVQLIIWMIGISLGTEGLPKALAIVTEALRSLPEG